MDRTKNRRLLNLMQLIVHGAQSVFNDEAGEILELLREHQKEHLEPVLDCMDSALYYLSVILDEALKENA